MQSQTKIFSQLVRDYMRDSPAIVPGDSAVAAMLGSMAAAKASSALIVDAAGRLTGIVTERDIARRIALRCQGPEPVTGVMTTPVQAIGADDYLYTAIARMRRFGWRHMPVVDSENCPVGIIRLPDALAVASKQVLDLIEQITHEGSLDGLREIKAAQVVLAEYLFQDNVPAPEIQALITDINRDIHRRILDAQIAAMAEEGWGAPPVLFAAIIMGSGGRGENYLFPDQDNGFILDNYPDEDHARIDRFFIELAERFTRDLDAVGFPFCRGYVMATNPVWRKTRNQWHEQLKVWARRRGTIAVQFSDIFFDFQTVYGVTAMVRELRQQVTRVAKANPAYLAEIEKETTQYGVALGGFRGWFGRFVTEKENQEHKGSINLKHAGTLPLITYLRLLALREGIEETATLRRIEALYDKGVLSADEQDYLRGAFHHITGLLLRQQIADFKANAPVSNFVHPDKMSEREKDILFDSFKAIEALRDRVHAEFTADVF